MPRGPHLGKDTGAVHVIGLRELQSALKRVDRDAAKEVRKGLREIGNTVRDRARANIEHKTGRHGQDGPIKVRTSVTARAVSVYANAPHARVQDVGGRVGHGALITRARASAYMTKAVDEGRAEVEVQLNKLGDRLEGKFESG